MKIKLRSNGQIINPPLRVAQRYIRLGRASVYKEPEPVIEKPKKKYKKKEKSSASEAEKEQKLSSTEVSKGSDSTDTGQRSAEVDSKEYSGTGD